MLTVNGKPEDEPEVIQLPPIEKQPLVKLIPFANVDEAIVDVTERRFVEMPPTKVDVAVDVDINVSAITLPATANF